MAWQRALGRRPANADASLASSFPGMSGKTGAELGFAASCHNVKSCHTVLPEGNRGTAFIETRRRSANPAGCLDAVWPIR